MRDPWWGRKVARLPSAGTLLVATDLQGNLGDYLRLEAIYHGERAAGAQPVLALCGDLVHGPPEQICVSTSFGCDDADKVYLRLDLSRRYASVHDLAVGREILPLWGAAGRNR